MKMQEIRNSVESLWDSMAEGWDRLRQSAAGALTRFRPGDKSNLPARDQIDDDSWVPGMGWSMLGGDVFEDDKRVVVRIEAPGMAKNDFDIEVFDDRLLVRGEKRFEREDSDGRWRVLQCAYGSFHRSVPLPAAVLADKARASYRDGVLRVELPKARAGRREVKQIRVA
ncbi:MAG: Hsp20/alpha crystallin family protein [Rhizobacter sp.]|nr:Hsp20/alpha crystallin family protein [Rhizobacter sp.]